MNIVPQSQFDETKLNFKQVPQMNNESAQYTLLFNYKFQPETDHALLLTDPLKVRGKCIPKIDGMWKKKDNECLYCYLNLDEPDGQLLRTQVIDKIDNKFAYLCGDSSSFVNVGDKVIKKLHYMQYLKEVLPPGFENEDSDDDGNNDEKKEQTNPIYRIKIQFDTEYQTHHSDTPKKIKTRVFLPVDKSVPINDREFNSEPEVVTCLDDLRQLFHLDCTVRLVLKINRFWIQKAPNDLNMKRCGLTIKCMQIYVLDDPQWFKFTQDKPIIMPGLKIAKTTKKYEPEDDDKVLIEESDDDDDCGDDDDE